MVKDALACYFVVPPANVHSCEEVVAAFRHLEVAMLIML